MLNFDIAFRVYVYEESQSAPIGSFSIMRNELNEKDLEDLVQDKYDEWLKKNQRSANDLRLRVESW